MPGAMMPGMMSMNHMMQRMPMLPSPFMMGMPAVSLPSLPNAPEEQQEEGPLDLSKKRPVAEGVPQHQGENDCCLFVSTDCMLSAW